MGKYITAQLEGINYFFRVVVLSLFCLATTGIIGAVYLSFKHVMQWF